MAVQMSETMAALSMGKHNVSNYSRTLVLFEGDMPSKADFEAALATIETAEGRIGGLPLKTWADGLLNNAVLAEVQYPSSLNLEYLGPRDFRFNISRQYENMTVNQNGVPTWFMFIGWYNTTQRAYGTSVNLESLIIGSCGDENSSADMKLKGGAISTDIPLRANDIEIRVN